jgi:hypothetical protein
MRVDKGLFDIGEFSTHHGGSVKVNLHIFVIFFEMTFLTMSTDYLHKLFGLFNTDS